MKLVVFDYDGVLMDTFVCTVKIYLDIFEKFHLDLPHHPGYFRNLFELDWRETLKKINITSQEDIEIQEEIYRIGLRKYGSLIKPYPKIKEVIMKLSKKYTLAIVTNNIREELDYRLKKFGLAKYFSAVFTEEDGISKPHPDLLIKCLKKLNIEPKESIFIGDMDGDILCGRAAKIGKMVAVTYGYHQKHRLKDADIIVETPNELLELLTTTL